ncbi:MAG TPA: alpha/beta fold hydrolase [Solirubrobacteraceae bacterium]|jgi:pimeloyl-ACP methyl ester carboxylesterase
MQGTPLRHAAAAALLLLFAALPASAEAVGLGAPGKVAVTNPGEPLRIWDPVQAVNEAGQDEAGFTTIPGETNPKFTDLTFSAPSRPQWSPDGTMLAFTRVEDDPGDREKGEPMPFQQTSIYLYRVKDKSVTRLTTPEPRLIDRDGDELSEGHIVTDYAPTFTGDGTQVAFLRYVDAGEDDPLDPDNGVQMWTVPVTGGKPARRTNFEPYVDPELWGIVGIPGTTSFLGTAIDDQGYVVEKLQLGSSSMQEIPGTHGVDAVPATLDVAPDGTRFSRTEIIDGETFGAVVRKLDGSIVGKKKGIDGTAFSPTGNGAIGHGCVREDCGLVETLGFADGTPRDTGGDDQRIASKFPADDSGGLLAVQPQTLPIVFLPGFLGSEIKCGSKMEWPNAPADSLGMQLAADGRTNAGCLGSAPTGKAIESFLSSDVYEGVSNALKAKFGDRAVVMGWDWRKRAEESWKQLDDTVDGLTSTGEAQAQDVHRVVLWGHSYGGLLARSYLTQHPEKVAQILSVGSPFLGSPKVVFPLAFGVETPMFSTMDLLFDNDDLKTFARNLAGLYELMPSPKFPHDWFSIDGVNKSTAQMVERLHGNMSLLGQAHADHANLFDGFETDDGRVDVRALVGTGIGTVDRIDLQPYEGEDDDITIHLGNGDKTVPGMSANQGDLGTSDPLGDDIRVQYQCDVDHVALANDPQVIAAYIEWADHDAVPLQVEKKPCDVDGEIYDFTPGEIDDQPAAAERVAARRAGAAQTLADAEKAELVDVMRLPKRTFVTTDRRRSGTLTVVLQNATFRVTPVGPGGEGTPVEYGPVTGTATIAPASSPGGLPTITVGGAPVVPHDVPADGGTGNPSGGSGSGSGGGDGAGAQAGGDRDGQPTQPPLVRPTDPAPPVVGPGKPVTGAPKLRLVGRPRLRGRVLTLSVAVPGKGTLRTKVTARGKKLAQRTARAKGARTLRVSLRLPARPRSGLRVAMTFAPAGGNAVTLNVAVK